MENLGNTGSRFVSEKVYGGFDSLYESPDTYDAYGYTPEDLSGMTEAFSNPFIVPEGGFINYDPHNLEPFGLAPSDDESSMYQLQSKLAQYPEDTSIAEDIKNSVFETLGVGKETAAAISAFAKAANRGGGKEKQAQGSGRVGPQLPSSARAPTSQAGRTSRAGRATSGEQAVQRAIQQSARATSAARAIANQMARAGTVTSTNDLADMISGSTKPMGTKQKLPGGNLRQLAIPRTQMA